MSPTGSYFEFLSLESGLPGIWGGGNFGRSGLTGRSSHSRQVFEGYICRSPYLVLYCLGHATTSHSATIDRDSPCFPSLMKPSNHHLSFFVSWHVLLMGLSSLSFPSFTHQSLRPMSPNLEDCELKLSILRAVYYLKHFVKWWKDS